MAGCERIYGAIIPLNPQTGTFPTVSRRPQEGLDLLPEPSEIFDMLLQDRKHEGVVDRSVAVDDEPFQNPVLDQISSMPGTLGLRSVFWHRRDCSNGDSTLLSMPSLTIPGQRPRPDQADGPGPCRCSRSSHESDGGTSERSTQEQRSNGGVRDPHAPGNDDHFHCVRI